MPDNNSVQEQLLNQYRNVTEKLVSIEKMLSQNDQQLYDSFNVGWDSEPDETKESPDAEFKYNIFSKPFSLEPYRYVTIGISVIFENLDSIHLQLKTPGGWCPIKSIVPGFYYSSGSDDIFSTPNWQPQIDHRLTTLRRWKFGMMLEGAFGTHRIFIRSSSFIDPDFGPSLVVHIIGRKK